MFSKTIAAIATPPGSGGIGIVKISGPQSIPIAQSIFHTSQHGYKNAKDSCILRNPSKTKRMLHGYIFNKESGRILDEVLLLVMPGPGSYTREDVVEIQCHGGLAVTHAVLDLVLKYGAVLAEPGEFTKIAFLNGRIDLTQAEAVMDLIQAGSERELEIATKQLRGGLKQDIEPILKTLEGMVAEWDAAIDFPEEVEDLFKQERIVQKLKENVINPVEGLIQRHLEERTMGKILKVVIVGKPNVGKSSLMNCLLGKDRVIVSDVAGTTRDYIEDVMVIGDLRLTLADTAGLHDTGSGIDKVAQEKTLDQLETADLVLFVVDFSSGIDLEEKIIHKKIRHKKSVLVMNKSDLNLDNGLIKQLNLLIDREGLPAVSVSAKYHTNIECLKSEIFKMLSEVRGGLDPGHRVPPNVRHYHCLVQCLEHTNSALVAIKDGFPAEICVIDIENALHCLEEVMGISIRKDILDAIFNQFCIGK
jgi:tRNA modification GTPase